MKPVRTCVGCRVTGQRDTLLRVVLRHRQLECDERKVLPGRGAWLHPAEACLDKAIARRAFHRALRVSGELETTHLREQAERLMDKK